MLWVFKKILIECIHTGFESPRKNVNIQLLISLKNIEQCWFMTIFGTSFGSDIR